MKSLAPNSLIQNRYLIVHLIGKGGMGEVYLAVDQRLGSAVALKRTFFADDELLGNAFEREARILARLRHPVLPKVSDHFAENGEQYLVMEHIAGEDLAKRLEAAQKPFPLSWVLFWADQLLDALAYLHSHEPPIIHRDIKPQNLKLTDENHIVLLDFGLSKNTTGQTQATGGSSGSTGSVVGYTPHYAPMEQIRGTGTDPRSDIYSLSATLYQLMSNTVPADALTRADALLNGSPDSILPLDQVNPEVPHEVSTVILHGMEVSQEKRFPDAKSMQKALRKAYSEMQQAMSAQTMVYNSGSEFSSKIEQPTGTTGSSDYVSQPRSDSEATKIKSEPSVPLPSVPTETPNFAETIRYDGPIVDSVPRQADIKTEVYSAANSPFASEIAPPPLEPTPTPNIFPSTPTNVPSTPPAENWDATIAGGQNGGFAADATVANMAYDAGAPASPYGEQTTNFSSTSAPASDSYATDAYRADSYSTSQPATSQPITSQPAAAQTQPKKKSSKALWVVGGLAILFFFGLVAAGGGYFVYTNYFEASAAPSPTPEPTVEVTPTPEPTFDASINSNSNTDVTSAANTNTNSNSTVFVEPTPEPTTETATRQEPNPRNTPNIEVRKTPGRTPSGTQTATKPTPKTTTTKPTILQ